MSRVLLVVGLNTLLCATLLAAERAVVEEGENQAGTSGTLIAFSHDPNYMFSEDNGKTWKYGGRLLYGRDGYSPYLKYAYDGKGTIHFVTTEDHPRNFDNSLYHGYLRDGTIFTWGGMLTLAAITIATKTKAGSVKSRDWK